MILPRLLESLIGTVPAIIITAVVFLAFGALFVPLLIWLKVPGMSRSLAEIVCRLHVALQMVAYGWAMALVHRVDGTYETVPMDRDGDQVHLDGSWRGIERSENGLHRFAGGWFTELDERGGMDLYVDPEDVETQVMQADGGREIQTDIVDRTDLPGIGEVYGFNPFHGEDGGVLIDLVPFGMRVKNTNSGEAAKKGVERGLEEGADLMGPSAIFYGLMVVAMILLAVISGGSLIILGEWMA